MKILDDITTPQELLQYMNNNVEYGCIGKNNNKVYTYEDDIFPNDWVNEYYLQSPKQLLNSRYGFCFDQVELEREWFSKNNYNFKTFFLWFDKQEENNLPTHTFLSYKDGNKWYWFENSFGLYKGIHEYNNLKELIEDIKAKQLEYAISERVATQEDYFCIKEKEYSKPEYGISVQEFFTQIFEM